MPAICVTVMEDPYCSVNGRVLRVMRTACWRACWWKYVKRQMLPMLHDHEQSACTTEPRDHCHAVLSDDVGLHLEFGRRFFFFTLQSKPSEVAVEATTDQRLSVNEALYPGSWSVLLLCCHRCLQAP